MKTVMRALLIVVFVLVAVGTVKSQPANDLFANGWVLSGTGPRYEQ